MSSLRLLLGDQLSEDINALSGVQAGDHILMAEVMEEATYVPHHPQKIALVFSAMRHFAEELEAQGLQVDYVRLDDRHNTGSLAGEVKRALQRLGCDRVVLTEPSEWRLFEAVGGWQAELGVAVEVREDDRFLCSHAAFHRWAKGRRQLRMEFFYREMRRHTGWLMEEGEPSGGAWNFDRQNRKKMPKALQVPDHPRFRPDAVTGDVMALVAERFGKNFGALDGFSWAVTRTDALRVLQHFITELLPQFGDYQDAMRAGEDFAFHSLLSPYLNLGLLNPREVCEAAVAAHAAGDAPIHCVEGFVRQILGWREFVRGVYWLRMPDYAQSCALDARRNLPAFYWGGETSMRCMAEAVDATRRNAYAHHIQRLMVTGNFALLAGIEPAQVEKWYLAVYADAFEWAELPNTHGMALFADGGVIGSKPYAASGAYINRMSDYCKGCKFSPREKTGENACPFNFLYWDFLARNADVLRGNPRMALAYRNLDRMDGADLEGVRAEAVRFLDGIPS